MGGETEDMKETMADLIFALGIAIFLIYFILAAQFESFVLPFIIMGSVPLSVSGVIIGLIVTQYKFNIMVMVGIIMLAGIVVNNAIVLIDYINLLRAKGENLERAVRDSGSTRLRPILMTTLTTVFGMIPLALGIGDGSEIYQGMAIAVIFGLVFSTILTLVYIPVLYMLIENRKEKKKWKRDEKERKRRESLYKS
jgi:HAE1 family hydrophobic/amphiphilic exporter-1